MDVYLAGEHLVKNGNNCKSWDGLKILELYFYARKNKNFNRLVKSNCKLLLDSGAFTIMSGTTNAINWDRYIEQYADFINVNNIKLFFELDIDGIIGLHKVEQLREKLESLTGKKPIPVWHGKRGKQYFIDMCKNYPYVALGGLAQAGDKATRKKMETAFPWFINIAHQHQCKIHGLGYTNLNNLKKFHFDSVDSTAWLYGNRGGYIYQFNFLTGLMEQYKKENARVKTKETAMFNFNEWIKFSRYAEKYL